MNVTRLLPFFAFLPLSLGCVVTAASEVGDPENSTESSSLDGGCLPDATADETRGTLALVNDSSVSAADLHAVGVSTHAATGIVAARPIADLAALDAVPMVGPVTCKMLRNDACDLRGLCEPELSLWTWNIEHFPLTPAAVADVAKTLTDMRAELVGFEEVDSLTAFSELLGELPGWQGIPGQTGFETQVAVAYDGDRLHVVDKVDLFTNDSYRFPRPPLAVTFDVSGRVGTSRVTLVVVHLKAQVDADSKERRRQAVIALEQWIAARRAAGDDVFAVGDWNDDVDVDASSNVFEPFLTQPDVYDALTLPAAKAGEYSYIPFQRLIDHQFATHEAAQKFQPVAVDPIALEQSISSYVKTVSDHRPVRARLIPIIPKP